MKPCLRSILASAWVRWADTKANRANSFLLKLRSESSLFWGKEIIWSRTVETFHIWLYFGFGGVTLKTPFSNLTTRGCWPAACQSIKGTVEDRADLYTFKVEYDFPTECSWAKKLTISAIAGDNGFVVCWLHQPVQLFHADSYCFSVLERQDLAMRLEASIERPFVFQCSLRWPKRPGVGWEWVDVVERSGSPAVVWLGWRWACGVAAGTTAGLSTLVLWGCKLVIDLVRPCPEF